MVEPDKKSSDSADEPLISHLEALRSALLKCLAGTALLLIPGMIAAPRIVSALTHVIFSGQNEVLHYFRPMEVFWIQIKTGLITALTLSYPWNAFQLWRFFSPALYEREKKAILWWLSFSSVLFFSGVLFCVFLIMPMLMRFAMGFATSSVQPVLGIGSVMELTGWLSLAFGLMFQTPTVVFTAVKFGFVSVDSVRRMRPYVMTAILVVAAILTPPDVISQLSLAIPSWLLFEIGLFITSHIVKQERSESNEQQ